MGEAGQPVSPSSTKCFACRGPSHGNWYCPACAERYKDESPIKVTARQSPVDGIQTFGMGNPGHGRMTRAYERECYSRRTMPDGQVLPGYKRKNPTFFFMGK
jgi:hypothetical protein